MKRKNNVLEKMLKELESIEISAILIAKATEINPGRQEILKITAAKIAKLNQQLTKTAISIQMKK